MVRRLSLLLVVLIVGLLIPTLVPTTVSAMTGSGTEGDPYVIYNVNDLQAMNLDLDAYYELGNDIDASAFAFIPLGTFTGTLDGKGYSIANLNITQSGSGWLRIALFSINQGTIKHIKLTNCFISVSSSFEADAAGLVSTNIGIINDSSTTGTIKAIGTGVDPMACAAGLVWWNKGVITSSYSTAAVIATSTGHALAGGFIGGNDLGGQVTKSFAVGNVICTGGGTGSALGGGFVYVNYSGNITNCYSRGNVTASGALYNWVGGFIEYNEDIIEDSYSTGIPTASGTIGGFCADNIGTITSSFWDTDTSGTVVSDGGTGKNTTEMKTKSTFTNAGWLFSPESETPIWAISEYCNDGYPYICSFCYLPWLCIGGCTSYTLTTSSTLGGNVTAPGEGSYTYGSGQVVSLNVTPEDGYSFYRWSGQTSTIGDRYSGSTNITMNGTYSIMANFQSGDLLPFPVIPIITPEEEEADPSILPWYDLIHPAAVGLGWRTIDFWSILIIFIAIAMGVGVMIATGSTLLAAITVAIVLFVGVSMSILSLWVVIVYAIFSGSYLIAVRAM